MLHTVLCKNHLLAIIIDPKKFQFLSFSRFVFEGIDEGSLSSALDRAFSYYKESKLT